MALSKKLFFIASSIIALSLYGEDSNKNLNYIDEIVAITIDPSENQHRVPKEILSEEVQNFITALDKAGFTPKERDSILTALEFAAHKHHNQFRQNFTSTPYLTHPIEVALVLINEGHIKDTAAIKAALLHDTLETDPHAREALKKQFGAEVYKVVDELTIKGDLSIVEKKRIELERAAQLSSKAKLVKLADRIVNVRELKTPPAGWTKARVNSYLLLSDAIFKGLKGTHPELEKVYKNLLDEQFSAQ